MGNPLLPKQKHESILKTIKKISSPEFWSALEIKTSRLFSNLYHVVTLRAPSTYKPSQQVRRGARLAVKLSVVALVGTLAAFLPPTLAGRQAGHGPVSQSIAIASTWGDSNIDIWWPTDSAKVTGVQPFKAVVNNRAIDQYRMVWQVDGGQQNQMATSMQDWPHKETNVDLTGWNWKGSGPYTLSFTAFDNSGSQIGQKFEVIYITSGQSAPVVSTPAPVKAIAPAPIQAATLSQQKLDVWWPTNNVSVSGTLPVKAMLENTAVTDYTMTFRVGSGPEQDMGTNYSDYPHKETSANTSQWGSGSVTLNFTAKNVAGQVIGTSSVTVNVQTPAGQPAATAATQPAAVPVSGNPFSGAKLFVDPNSDAKKQADAWRSSQPQNASFMDKIANQPTTFWMGNWNSDITGDTRRNVQAAQSQGAMPVFVAYNIPQRDCGGYSAGGSGSPDAYKQWIRSMAAGIGSAKSAVIIEPDAIALIDCLSGSDQQTRYSLIRDAVSVFKSLGNTAVYIDAAHPGWLSVGDMVSRLKNAGIDQADGFSLDISNFYTTQDNVNYGTSISNQVGGKHFVVDTGRNGNGPTPDYQWCNPSGRALGQRPTTATGNALVDAYLWVKGPGGSDGNCNGGPNAGVFWPDYALGLAQRASW